MQYIYLIRLREFVRLNEPTYKVGKTTQTPNGRLGGYPSGSEVYLFKGVSNCHELEKRILVRFKQIFVHRKEYGAETFSGPVVKMIEVIEHEVALYNIEMDMKPINQTVITNIELQKSKEQNALKEPITLLNNFDQEILVPPRKIKVTDNEHMHELQKKYKLPWCHMCRHYFTNHAVFWEHFERDQCSDNYTCCLCRRVYKNKSLLENHIKTETCTLNDAVSQCRMIWQCECGHTFVDEDALKFHQEEYCKTETDRLAIRDSKDIIRKCIIDIRSCMKTECSSQTIDIHVQEMSKQESIIRSIQEKQGYYMDEIINHYSI